MACAGGGESADADGVWLGAGAARLDLASNVERDDLDGRGPATGFELGRHHPREKNVAFHDWAQEGLSAATG